MALGVIVGKKKRSGGLRSLLPWSWLGLALASTSCTPVVAVQSAELQAPLSSAPVLTISLNRAPAPAPAATAPATLLSPQPAASFAFRGVTALDSLRSHDCLAQAIYYEAASESEEGQRAVAQVVLNRVRHPSWPNSVCGVVYQGPMRPGGGCQFTFTCDGSLARRATGPAWDQARRLAAEALAGRSPSGVGLATHYHTHAVSPAWAPRLAAVGVIGAHRFYRLPGSWGEAGAFTAAYAGSEPLPRPTRILFPRATTANAGLAGLAPFPTDAFVPAAPADDVAADPASDTPPPSTIREEYRHSGQWREDAPAALTRSTR